MLSKEEVAARQHRYYLNNREERIYKANIRADIWRKLNPKKIAKIQRRTYLKNKEDRIAKATKRNKKQAAELQDRYIRVLLSKNTALLSEDIPQALVELKREELKLIRLIKREKDNGKKHQSTKNSN